MITNWIKLGQHGLTCQTQDSGHEIEITLYKVNQKQVMKLDYQ